MITHVNATVSVKGQDNPAEIHWEPAPFGPYSGTVHVQLKNGERIAPNRGDARCGVKTIELNAVDLARKMGRFTAASVIARLEQLGWKMKVIYP